MPFYGLVRGYAWSLVASHYRLRPVGGQIPMDGPMILVCNHNNGLVDGAVQFDITRRQLRVLAKFALFETFGIRHMVKALGAIPVYRQKDGVDTSKNISAFQAIGEALRAGGAILLFPEGESSFHHQVRPFHTGVARMALGAEDSTDFTCGIQLVPVGLAYDEPFAYRSDAWLWVGEPVMCTNHRELYQSDGRRCVRVFLAELVEAQKAVTVELDEPVDHHAVCFGEPLLPPSDLHVPARRKVIAEGIGRLRTEDPGGAAQLVDRLAAWGRGMQRRGLRPSDLEQPPGVGAKLFGVLQGLLIWIGLASLGLLVAPPFLLSRLLARRSSAPRDKVVTITVLLASVIVPAWALVLALAAGLGWTPWFALALPAAVIAALLIVPQLYQRRRTLRRALTLLVPGAIATLRSEGQDLRDRVAALPTDS